MSDLQTSDSTNLRLTNVGQYKLNLRYQYKCLTHKHRTVQRLKKVGQYKLRTRTNIGPVQMSDCDKRLTVQTLDQYKRQTSTII